MRIRRARRNGNGGFKTNSSALKTNLISPYQGARELLSFPMPALAGDLSNKKEKRLLHFLFYHIFSGYCRNQG
jgi:hypothetical protein